MVRIGHVLIYKNKCNRTELYTIHAKISSRKTWPRAALDNVKHDYNNVDDRQYNESLVYTLCSLWLNDYYFVYY